LAAGAQTILDVGSHIGTFALVAAAANPRARVVAVEADERNFQLMQANCGSFTNLTAVRRRLRIARWNCGFVRRCERWRWLPERATSADPRCYRLHTCSLTELCVARAGDGGLDKMDVEGFEHTIIVGDEEFWQRFAPRHLVIELTIPKAARSRRGDFSAMERRGYTARRVQGLYAVPWGKPDDLANWHFAATERSPTMPMKTNSPNHSRYKLVAGWWPRWR